MNETATSPGTTYTYDNAGNMITSKTGSTTTTYTYDYRNRLTGVTTGGTVVATYTYNALNQRIGVKDSGTQTWTVYDGTSPDANPYADFNGSGSLTERYLFGPGVVNGAVMSVILARTSSGGTTAWYLTDKLGSVRDIVDTSGNELDHIVYDSFGNIVTETNATNGDRFKFAGMQYDATTGQYYDHARWYDAATGRFARQDPLGFAAADANMYRYVGNSPTNFTDKSGLLSDDANLLLDAYKAAYSAGLSNEEITGTIIIEALYINGGNNAAAFALIMDVRQANMGALDNDLWASADHFLNAWNAQDLFRTYMGENFVSRSLGGVSGDAGNLCYSLLKRFGVPVGRDNPDIPPTDVTVQQWSWGNQGAWASIDIPLTCDRDRRTGGASWIGWKAGIRFRRTTWIGRKAIHATELSGCGRRTAVRKSPT